MDLEFTRPRHRAAAARPSAPSYAVAHQNTISAMSPVASVLQQAAVPTTTTNQPVKQVDFKSGAKAYRKSRTFESLAHAFALSVYILIAFAILLAAGGVYVNKKYTGKALPFTYIGDISVGGLTQAEIKSALDTKVKAMQITFIDGGLTRTVPISKFAATVDTDAASKQAIVQKFNPFEYLGKRRYVAAVTINDRQLTGYTDLILNVGKTPSANAKIVADKNKLVIMHEVLGFKTNPQLMSDKIKVALSNINDPIIRLSNLNYKPQVYSTDLEDDLSRANTMVNSAIVIEYGRSVARPSLEQKMSWLQIAEIPGSDNVSLSFSKTLVRQYVLDLAKKYQGQTLDPAKVANPASVMAITQQGNVINNIDEATDEIVRSLNTAQPRTQKLTTETGTYNKLVTTN